MYLKSKIHYFIGQNYSGTGVKFTLARVNITLGNSQSYTHWRVNSTPIIVKNILPSEWN